MTNFLPNRLNDYETYTYNLKLYMVDPRDFSRLDSLIGTNRAVLIADNAQFAKYNISDCEQLFVVGHGQVREALANNFNFTIHEPNGVTLLSTIKTIASSLGIGNHLHAGYIIEVEFNGRRADGVANKFNQIFYYAAVITNFNFKVDQGGSIYQITFVDQGSAGYRYLSNHVPAQITIVSQTVGEFFDLFEAELNASMLDVWAANPSASQYPTRFKFEFDASTTQWREWRFQVLDNPFEYSGIEFVGLPGENPSLQVSVPNGTMITALFSYILQLTAEYKNILITQGQNISREFARNAPNELAGNAGLDSFPVFMKVLSNIEYGDFDILSNEYSKTIVFRLKAYVVTDLVLESDLYKRGITNVSVQTKRAQNLVSSGFLRKRYDYLYTGLNTEVLDFNMDFNFAYFSILPYGEGYFGDARVQSPQFINDKPEVIGRLSNLAGLVSEAAQTRRDADRLRAQRADSPVIINVAFERAARAQTRLNQAISRETQALYAEYQLTPDEIAWGLRWAQDAVSGQDMNTSDNDERSGTLKMGAVKVNLESSADLNSIELHIRGDPYWMGVPNSFQQKTRNVDNLADYESGSINFVLLVNLPVTDEDENGRRKPSPDFQLSGVFKVINVINRFQNGKFTQHLKAVRDLATNLPTVWNTLANDNLVDRARRSSDLVRRDRDTAQIQEDANRQIGPQ